MSYETRLFEGFSIMRTLVRFLVVISAILAVTSPAEAVHIIAGSSTCDFFSLSIQGNAISGTGNQPFFFNTTVGYFLVLRRTGVRTNPVELVFSRDFTSDGAVLNQTGQPGDIELMTNSIYANNLGKRLQRLDLAVVRVSTFRNPQDLYQFQLDPVASVDQPPPNVMVVPGQGGLLGGLGFLPGGLSSLGFGVGSILSSPGFTRFFLTPNTGSGFVFFPTTDRRTPQGQIAINGVDATGASSLTGRYLAGFTGNFVGSFQCN
jgi:hypothetical protein